MPLYTYRENFLSHVYMTIFASSRNKIITKMRTKSVFLEFIDFLKYFFQRDESHILTHICLDPILS